jgi:putative transposase
MLVPNLIEKLKPITTKWMNNTFPELERKFGWQEGYAAFSVDRSNLQPIINYIENQEEHHKKVSYQDEYIAFLKAQGIAFDPRFVFD